MLSQLNAEFFKKVLDIYILVNIVFVNVIFALNFSNIPMHLSYICEWNSLPPSHDPPKISFNFYLLKADLLNINPTKVKKGGAPGRVLRVSYYIIYTYTSIRHTSVRCESALRRLLRVLADDILQDSGEKDASPSPCFIPTECDTSHTFTQQI